MVWHKQKVVIKKTLQDEKWIAVILALISISHFLLIPVYGDSDLLKEIIKILWIIILLSGIISTTMNKRMAILFSVIPMLLSIFYTISVFNPTPFLFLMEFLFSIFSLILFIILVLIRILADGPITGYRIMGSVVVYLLMAQLWALTYTFMYKHLDDAFQISFNLNENNLRATFLYFSYTTITTTGFGDIIPVNPMVRSVVQIESIIGVLYPVILIGSLVSGVTSPKKEGGV